MVVVEEGKDMNCIASSGRAIGCQPWVLDSATCATMLVKQDMVVEGRQMRHYLIVLPKRGGQSRVRVKLKDLKRDLLAN